ncbi:MAG: 3-deoxy-D-manno-octulosonic acid transferase [Pseudomonadota bacterium]|nr:3-deoxy-D-manno-octulosonic acid transferase [Pseudomonadota bacterium]
MKSFREPLYRSFFKERFGFFKRKDSTRDCIWIHAVSVGEAVAAYPLINNLVTQNLDCIVTSTTPAGKERVQQLLGNKVQTAFVPLDFRAAIKRFISNNNPRALIISETELWPNMIAECQRRKIKILLVNGRMSKSSAQTYRNIRFWTKSMFEALDYCGVQTPRHRNRFISLGVKKNKIEVTGNLKFDIALPNINSGAVDSARALVGHRTVLLGASTHEGEEDVLLNIFHDLLFLFPNLLLILAPRHMNRISRVNAMALRHGFNPELFSKTDSLSVDKNILIIDEMGLLPSIYCCAHVAFVGGSLVPLGGHNMLEGVRAGCPIIMGPFIENIEDIAREFEENGGMSIVKDASALKNEIKRLMLDSSLRSQMRMAADAILESNKGSLKTTELGIVKAINRN